MTYHNASLNSRAVCPMINRIIISALDDGLDSTDDSNALGHAIAHMSAALVILDGSGIEFDQSMNDAARKMADVFNKWADQVNARSKGGTQ